MCEVFSKRSDDIAEHLARTGQNGYRARGVAARATRSVKRHTGVDELLPTWHQELARSAGRSNDSSSTSPSHDTGAGCCGSRSLRGD